MTRDTVSVDKRAKQTSRIRLPCTRLRVLVVTLALFHFQQVRKLHRERTAIQGTFTVKGLRTGQKYHRMEVGEVGAMRLGDPPPDES